MRRPICGWFPIHQPFVRLVFKFRSGIIPVDCSGMNPEQPASARSCIRQAAVFFPTSPYFESSLPVACHPPMPGEVVMNPDSCLEHVIHSCYVVMPCDEAERFTIG